MSRLAAALTVVAMLVLQVAPVAASASGSGMWVEICSEAGVVLKQVGRQDAEGTDHGACPAGSQCPFCAISHPDAVLSGGNVAWAAFGVTVERSRASQTYIGHPARFWPENRGPPRAERTMRRQMHDRGRAPAAQSRGAPWA